MSKFFEDFKYFVPSLPDNNDPRFRVTVTPYNVRAASSAHLLEERPDGDLYVYDNLGVLCGSAWVLVVKDGLVIKEMSVLMS